MSCKCPCALYIYAAAKPDALLIAFRHDLTDTTRAMAKRGSEDLKKLSSLQTSLVSLSE